MDFQNIDMEKETRMSRMRTLTIRCHDLTQEEIKELLQLRFDGSDVPSLKRFMLRVHPDKARGNVELSAHCEAWLAASRCAQRAIQVESDDSCEALVALRRALMPLYNLDTPPVNDFSMYHSDDQDEEEEVTGACMPTHCMCCNRPAMIQEVLSHAKYRTPEYDIDHLNDKEWQHAHCAALHRMPGEVHYGRLGTHGLAGTRRCKARHCFVDNETGAEIRVKKKPRGVTEKPRGGSRHF